MFAGSVTLTVRSVVTTDDGLGNTSEVVTESSWPGCMVAPRYANESSDPRVAPVVVGKEIYSDQPPPVVLDADDRIVVDGAEWQVEGVSADWPWPAGGMAGYVVPIKRVP